MAMTPLTMTPSAQKVFEQVENALGTSEQRVPELIARIRRRIAMFERMYGMSSLEMNTRLESGDLQETDDICIWRMELYLLHHVACSAQTA